MTEKTLTTENIKPALDALRGELAPWPVVAMKQDRLNDTQKSAVNSGITSSLVAQIIANTAAIRALESAITGTGLRALVVASLPATGTQGILYIVPVTTYDPATDADVVNYSNEYIWIVAPDAPVTEGYYEQVGQTGIVINNGQLTITVNGTSVGTFTANQSGDTTAAITVPTNADYVDKTTAQSIAGVKTFSDGIVSNITGNVTGNVTGDLTGTASKAIADEDGNNIKTTYGKLTGTQTWSGNNTFSGIKSTDVIRVEKNLGDSEIEIANKNIDITSNTSTAMDDIRFFDKNNKITGGLRVTYNNTQVQNSLSARSWSSDGTEYSNVAINIVSNYQNSAAYISVTNDFLPTSTNTLRLGNASYQWSSVYAQTYYYNGTAWGLDKSNTWTAPQIFSAPLRFNNASYVSGTPSADIFYATLQWGGYVNNTWTAPFTINNAVRTNGYSDTSFRTYSQTSNTLTGFVHETNADASDISFRPITNGTHKLGSSSYQWSSVYAQTYYYNGTAWGLDQANVWTGVNTFSHINRKFWSVEKGVLPAVNNDRYTYFLDKNGATLGYTQISYNTAGSLLYSVWLLNSYSNNQLDPAGSDKYAVTSLALKADGSRFFSVYADAIPNNTSWFNLGTSTNKWKTLNGINPGALSLPDVSNAVSIDTTDWDKTGNLISYTPPVDGWISIITDNSSAANYIRCAYDNGDILAKANGNGYAQGLSVFLPVLKNVQVGIRLVCTTIGTAKLYPCLGNV